MSVKRANTAVIFPEPRLPILNQSVTIGRMGVCGFAQSRAAITTKHEGFLNCHSAKYNQPTGYLTRPNEATESQKRRE